MARRLVRSLLLLACIAPLLVATSAFATKVRPVNLEQMTERAATVFAGRCVNTISTIDPQLGGEITSVTFEVDRVLKGDVDSTFTLRMLGSAKDSGKASHRIVGLPSFRPGDEVVLFLYGESDLGLSSPVGLGQGRFAVITDKMGNRIAVNDLSNKNLMRGISGAARERLGASFDQWKERKDLDPDALMDMVEQLVD